MTIDDDDCIGPDEMNMVALVRPVCHDVVRLNSDHVTVMNAGPFRFK